MRFDEVIFLKKAANLVHSLLWYPPFDILLNLYGRDMITSAPSAEFKFLFLSESNKILLFSSVFY